MPFQITSVHTARVMVAPVDLSRNNFHEVVWLFFSRVNLDIVFVALSSVH
jgi:hypothetical protein